MSSGGHLLVECYFLGVLGKKEQHSHSFFFRKIVNGAPLFVGSEEFGDRYRIVRVAEQRLYPLLSFFHHLGYVN